MIYLYKARTHIYNRNYMTADWRWGFSNNRIKGWKNFSERKKYSHNSRFIKKKKAYRFLLMDQAWEICFKYCLLLNLKKDNFRNIGGRVFILSQVSEIFDVIKTFR